MVLEGHLQSRESDESDNEQYSGTDTGTDSELERGRCREERGSCRDDDCVDIREGASGNQIQKPRRPVTRTQTKKPITIKKTITSTEMALINLQDGSAIYKP